MKCLNRIQLIGHVGRDPEVRSTSGGTTVARFSIATTERYTDRNNQQQERTEWHQIEAWKKLAEIAGAHVKKGDRLYVDGSIRTEEWQDKNTGEARTAKKIVIRDMIMLGSKDKAQSASAATNTSDDSNLGVTDSDIDGGYFDESLDVPF